MSEGKIKNDEYWRDKLSAEEFSICRDKGTEQAFTGLYYDHKAAGLYRCKCCDEALFSSESKYDSGSGWPSFYQALQKGAIGEDLDSSHGMTRTEVTCSSCGSHLGHLFTDGPAPTGMRYCINSASLAFSPKNDET